jgi:hypothetical protein
MYFSFLFHCYCKRLKVGRNGLMLATKKQNIGNDSRTATLTSGFFMLGFIVTLVQISSCDAPGFSAGYLTLMIRSTELTLVKRRSTWAITSKTSPTTPNHTPWSTHGQGWVKTLVKPLKHPLTLQCQPELLPRSPNFT